MIRRKAAGEQKHAVLYGLDKLCLRGIIGIKVQDIRGKDDSILAGAFCIFRENAVQLAGVDKVQGFRSDKKLLHIDFQAEISARKVKNLNLVMPVVFHESPFSGAAGPVKGAGKGFGTVEADLF